MKFYFYPLLAFFFALAAFGATWEESLSLPAPAPVVDEVGLLNSAEAQRVDGVLRQLKARSGVEISVLVASSLRERTIEEFSLAVAEQWKLGRKKEDKAILFVVAPNEKRMRFEVGYGMEGDITDAFSRRVLDQAVKPYFQRGQYGDGILAGLMALQVKVPLGLEAGEAPPVRSGKRTIPSTLVWILIVAFILFSFIGRLLGFSSPGYRRYGQRGWGGGLGGGGFGGGGSSWGGGGGGFGGGGASSSW